MTRSQFHSDTERSNKENTQLPAIHSFQRSFAVMFRNRITESTPTLGTVCVSQSVSKIHGQQIMHFPHTCHDFLETRNVFDELEE